MYSLLESYKIQQIDNKARVSSITVVVYRHICINAICEAKGPCYGYDVTTTCSSRDMII